MATNYERAKELVGESQDHWLLAPFIEEDRVEGASSCCSYRKGRFC